MGDHFLILITNIVLGVIINVALLIVARDFPETLQRSQRIWAQAGLWVVFTWILLGLRRVLGEPVSVIGAAFSLGFGFAEYARALAQFTDRKHGLGRSFAGGALMAAFSIVFYWFWPDRDLRAITNYLLAALLLGWVIMMASRARAFAPFATRLLLWVLVSLAILQLLRVVYTISTMPSPPDAMFASMPQQFMIAASTAGFALLAFSFSILCNERFNRELRHHVRFDSLTGTLNRASWRAELDMQFAKGKHSALLLIDIDHFKSINDRFGHDVGDSVLQAICTCARTLFGDRVGRLGGEEFAVLIENCDEQHAMERAEHFRRAVERLALGHGSESIKASVSIGVAGFDRFESSKAALKAADDAMYAAKRAGRNKVIRSSALVES